MKKSCLIALLSLIAGNLLAEALPPLPADAVTLAVIPDTQGYEGLGKRVKKGPPATGPTTNASFDSCIDWLSAHAESERIFFVSHTGDIVDNRNDEQFAFAARAMARLDGRVPYAVAPGNHDLKGASTALFVKYFPAAKFEGQPWYAGHFAGCTNAEGTVICADNANSCQLFDVGGLRLVFLHIECNAPDPVLGWASAMLTKHADRKAVIVTHQDVGFLEKKYQDVWNAGGSARRKAEKDGAAPVVHPDRGELGRLRWKKCHGKAGNTPAQAWEKCYSRHANVIMILSGDQGPVNVARLTAYGVHGNRVHCLMHDTQTHSIRLYRFIPSRTCIEVFSLNPRNSELLTSYNGWTDRADHQFTLDGSDVFPAK